MSEAVFNVVYIVSAVVLLLGMAAAEIYRWRSGKTGYILELEASGATFGLACARALVKLDSGEVVRATVPGCIQCLGRLRPGDRVRTNKTGREFIVTLPYGPTRRKKEPGTCESRTAGAKTGGRENGDVLLDGACDGRRE